MLGRLSDTMKRHRINLVEIADWNNLVAALHKAAKGKQHRDQVIDFFSKVEANLKRMTTDILAERMPYNRFRRFTIYDPKKRTIHAACFEDRIFHHALMNLAAPTLERAMCPTSFACRPGMGVHRAAEQVQYNIRRYAWYAKIDIAGYFASINHEILLHVLLRRFKGEDLIRLLQRILDGYQHSSRRGLPIGSLTSQYFANYYLDGLDRLLAQHPRVRAQIRYMDDIVWWCDNKEAVKGVLEEVRTYLWEQRLLTIKPTIQIQRCVQGISYCGYRILPGTMRLSIRRKRRYQQRRLYWEQQFRRGHISSAQLQNTYAAVHSITQGTDCTAWRRCNLQQHPPVSV